MDREKLNEISQKLHRQRKVYLSEFNGAETGLRFIVEDRESELEETAKDEQAARFLSCLDDRTIRQIEEIDAALERIEVGNYGKCQGCGQLIPVARLRLLPATRYCIECATKGQQPSPAAQAAMAHTVELPGDFSFLSDGELGTHIHEMVKEDGRIDTVELRIRCRKGVIYLYGTLPSEKERHMLLEILTDVLGLKELVDRIGVDELLWEREERSKRESSGDSALG